MSSRNKQYESALKNYITAMQGNIGKAGYVNSYDSGQIKGNQQTANAANMGKGLASEQMRNANAEAQKYAGKQASATAAGAQSQATTAARASGMNKAQAAMMGSQQNANAFQNAYGNAYNNQLGNYNNAYLTNASLANNNQTNQQNAAYNAQRDWANAFGSLISGAQAQGQQDRENTQQDISTAVGVATMLLPLLFSDERLKKYHECSKKVVMRTPSKLQALKITVDKGDK